MAFPRRHSCLTHADQALFDWLGFFSPTTNHRKKLRRIRGGNQTQNLKEYSKSTLASTRRRKEILDASKNCHGRARESGRTYSVDVCEPVPRHDELLHFRRAKLGYQPFRHGPSEKVVGQAQNLERLHFPHS